MKVSKGAKRGALVSTEKLCLMCSAFDPGQALEGGNRKEMAPYFLTLQPLSQRLKSWSPITEVNQGLPILPPAALADAVQGRGQPLSSSFRVAEMFSN